MNTKENVEKLSDEIETLKSKNKNSSNGCPKIIHITRISLKSLVTTKKRMKLMERRKIIVPTLLMKSRIFNPLIGRDCTFDYEGMEPGGDRAMMKPSGKLWHSIDQVGPNSQPNHKFGAHNTLTWPSTSVERSNA
ncbi:hypothetical protein Fot_02508 [Forsythia ovata]|uniref:Uncharacterized protein n=1 Tax=Forsythia ovata TaxID=205694 RepID=A0ABD1X729_9LAMI